MDQTLVLAMLDGRMLQMAVRDVPFAMRGLHCRRAVNVLVSLLLHPADES